MIPVAFELELSGVVVVVVDRWLIRHDAAIGEAVRWIVAGHVVDAHLRPRGG